MEKRAVIEPGWTPPEDGDTEQTKAATETAEQLEQHTARRAADAAVETLKQSNLH